MILPKKWCEHRNHEDFLVETFDQFLSCTTSHEVPTVGFLLQSQAMVKNTECPGERAKHFLFFFGGGRGQRRKVEGKTSWDFEVERKTLLFFFAGGVKGAQTVSAGEGIKIRTIYKLNFPYSPLFFDPSFLETGCCTGCFRVGHLPFVWRFPLSSLLMWFSPEEITTLGALTDIYFNHVILPLMVQKIFANQLRLVVDSTIIPLTTVLYHIAFFIFFCQNIL